MNESKSNLHVLETPRNEEINLVFFNDQQAQAQYNQILRFYDDRLSLTV